jgi:hypothetical protein
MDEWEADFKWTAEQHQVGAKFGSDQCSYLGSFDKIEQQSCSLLGRRN